MDELTNENFWESFWNGIAIPINVDEEFNNDHAIAEVIKSQVPIGFGRKKSACEFGCAPGKWLVFMNQKMGYSVHGIEYLESGVSVTERNLMAHSIPNTEYSIRKGDFLHLDPDRAFDVVFSLGLVEHFDDLDRAISIHRNWLATGGLAVIGMPSFRGINRLIQLFIDRYMERPLIPAHNLKSMDVDKLLATAKRSGFTIRFAGYVGGFEPALFPIQEIPNWIVRKLIAVALRAFRVLFRKSTNRFFSSYIMGVFERAESPAE